MNNHLDNETFKIIEALFTTIKEYKLPKAFQDSSMGPFETFGFSILTIKDEDGFISEVPISSAALQVLENILLPRLFSDKRISYKDIFNRMYWAIRNEGFRSTHVSGPLGTIDLAFYDLAAQRAGKPLHRFLGAEKDWANVYACGGGTNLSEKELMDEMTDFASRGFKIVKMKVGKNFGTAMKEDIERVKKVRETVGNNIGIAVDANQIWDKKNALLFNKNVEQENILWFEEPIHSADLIGIRELCEESSIPIAMGESEVCGYVFPPLVEAGVKHLQPIPGHMNKISDWLSIRDLAEKEKKQLSSGSFSHISCQFIATVNEDAHTELLVSIIGTMDDYYSIKPELKDGKYFLSDLPGLSIRFDWGKIKTLNQIGFQKVWKAEDFNFISSKVF